VAFSVAQFQRKRHQFNATKSGEIPIFHNVSPFFTMVDSSPFRIVPLPKLRYFSHVGPLAADMLEVKRQCA
jgi:hypothetical protein